MENQHIILRQLQPRVIETKDTGILTGCREQAALHALQLNAQDFDDIRIGDGILDALMDHDARFLIKEARQQCLRPCDVDFDAHLAHTVDIRAGDTAVQHIPDDGNLQPLQMPLVFLDCEEIQEAL